MNNNKNKITYLIILLFCIIMALPIFFIICGSFMSTDEIIMNFQKSSVNEFINMYFIPKRFSISQYNEILIKNPMYLRLFWNSFFVTSLIIVGNIIISFMVSYSLYRLNNKFTDIILMIYTIVMLMPYQALCVPNFIMINKLGLMDTFWAIILPAIFNPFGVFLLKQFMNTIPRAYFESAQMDGISEFNMCINIALPLCKAGISALAILLCVDYWNIIEQPLIFIQSSNKELLSVFLSTISNTNPAYIFASSVFFMIIPLLFFLDNEENLISGIQLSGLK